MIDLARRTAEKKYQFSVMEGLGLAEKLLPQALAECPERFHLGYVDSVAISAASGWTLAWTDYYNAWKSLTKRFGCAIYSGSSLCGLGMGRFNDSGRILRIEMMEGNPSGDHPFKGYVLDTVELVALICANEMGAEELRLINPVDGVKAYYTSKGYSLVTGSPTFCSKQVTL